MVAMNIFFMFKRSYLIVQKQIKSYMMMKLVVNTATT